LSQNGVVVASRTGLRTLHSDATLGVYPKFGIYGRAAGVDQVAWFGRYALTDTEPSPIGNLPPVANAGDDQAGIEAGSLVTLAGTDSDPDGTVVTRVWRQVSGPAVELTGSGSSRTYTAPTSEDGATLVFGYQVFDDFGLASAEDTVTHTVAASGGSEPRPSEIKIGRVVASLFAIGVDTAADPDDEPDMTRVVGSGILTPSVDKLLWKGADEPYTTFLKPVPFVITLGGVTTPGGRDLWVVANVDQTDATPAKWDWDCKLTISGLSRQPKSFKLNVSEGEDGADLTLQMPT